jgi:hypothetical protein
VEKSQKKDQGNVIPDSILLILFNERFGGSGRVLQSNKKRKDQNTMTHDPWPLADGIFAVVSSPVEFLLTPFCSHPFASPA